MTSYGPPDQEEETTAVTTIDLDRAVLDTAKEPTGARTDRDVVSRALRTLIAAVVPGFRHEDLPER